jgi:fatty acid desaturase
MSDASDALVEGTVCLANIGPRGRRQRLVFGLVTFAAALALLAVLAVAGVERWWRLLLFLPFATAATGYFQARDKT